MRLLILVSVLVSGPVLAAGCLGDFVSPDKSVAAKISSLNKSDESLVEFRSSNGQLLLKRGYSSPDMEHGSVIMHCAWTPDSKFFVYASYSSGGHQAWHFETTFYSKERNQLNEVDALVGAVTDPDFILKEPDLLHTFGWVNDESLVHVIRKAPGDQEGQPNFEYEVSLNKLLKDSPPPKSN